MSDFLRLIGEWIEFLWPFERVQQWEGGLRYRFGRYVRELSPGVYWRTPWFAKVITESVVPGAMHTPRIDITLKDGTLVSLQATAIWQVVDLPKAINTVEVHRTTTMALITAVIAEKLSEIDAERITPEKRGRLLGDLRRWVGTEVAEFGIEVTKLRFTTFVMKPKAIRLLGDHADIVGA